MKTATNKLIFKRGDSINYTFQVLDKDLNPVNFSGYTSAKMQLKENEFSSTAIATFSSTGSTYQIDISQKADGIITIKCDNNTIVAGTYLYDLQLSSSTLTETIVEGSILFEQDITI